jgi:hypothetical protein
MRFGCERICIRKPLFLFLEKEAVVFLGHFFRLVNSYLH